eukprot:m.25786 g.25786  ORF g.25786 m.25786 type:complete len:1556 (+) comp11422_c0_seq1:420-5087(+)
MGPRQNQSFVRRLFAGPAAAGAAGAAQAQLPWIAEPLAPPSAPDDMPGRRFPERLIGGDGRVVPTKLEPSFDPNAVAHEQFVSEVPQKMRVSAVTLRCMGSNKLARFQDEIIYAVPGLLLRFSHVQHSRPLEVLCLRTADVTSRPDGSVVLTCNSRQLIFKGNPDAQKELLAALKKNISFPAARTKGPYVHKLGGEKFDSALSFAIFNTNLDGSKTPKRKAPHWFNKVLWRAWLFNQRAEPLVKSLFDCFQALMDPIWADTDAWELAHEFLFFLAKCSQDRVLLAICVGFVFEQSFGIEFFEKTREIEAPAEAERGDPSSPLPSPTTPIRKFVELIQNSWNGTLEKDPLAGMLLLDSLGFPNEARDDYFRVIQNDSTPTNNSTGINTRVLEDLQLLDLFDWVRRRAEQHTSVQCIATLGDLQHFTDPHFFSSVLACRFMEEDNVADYLELLANPAVELRASAGASPTVILLCTQLHGDDLGKAFQILVRRQCLDVETFNLIVDQLVHESRVSSIEQLAAVLANPNVPRTELVTEAYYVLMDRGIELKNSDLLLAAFALPFPREQELTVKLAELDQRHSHERVMEALYEFVIRSGKNMCRASIDVTAAPAAAAASSSAGPTRSNRSASNAYAPRFASPAQSAGRAYSSGAAGKPAGRTNSAAGGDAPPVQRSGQRSPEELARILFSFFRVCKACNFIQGFAQISREQDFFHSLGPMGEGQPLRVKIADYFDQQKKEYFPGVSELLLSGKLMTSPPFFFPGIFDLLKRDGWFKQYPKVYPRVLCLAVTHMFTGPVFCDEFNSLFEALSGGTGDTGCKMWLLDLFLHNLEQRKPHEFSRERGSVVSLKDLERCIVWGADAAAKLQGSAFRTLESCFVHYIQQDDMSTWTALFKSADTIAYFIKYFTREKLDLAYQCFRQNFTELEAGHKEHMQDLLNRVEYQFPQSLVSLDDVGRKPAQQIIEDVAAQKYPSELMNMLKKLTVQWMKRTLELFKSPMPLHFTQAITFMLFAEHYEDIQQQDVHTSRNNVLVAQVGTGEGKSVILASMALHLVVSKGRKVHILENNTSLRNRDFSDFEEWYRSFTKPNGSQVTVSKSLDTDADICYCVKSELHSAYLSAMVGEKSFDASKMVLLVDEIDELIVDGEPVTFYVRVDDDMSALLPDYFRRLQAGQGKPDDVNQSVWSECSYAVQRVKNNAFVQGKHYALRDGTTFACLDDRGNFTNTYYLELEYLNFIHNSKTPKYQSVNRCIATPYLFKQYKCLFGLTGSVGGKAEQDFLRRTYGANVFKVPAFMNTCSECSKPVPKCIKTKIFRNTDAVFTQAVKEATTFQKKVPVIVIAKSPTEAERFAALLKRSTHAPSVRVLLRFINGREQTLKDIGSVVDEAGTQLRNSPLFPITVTSYFGGRGQDFKVRDEEVDRHGGLLVIMLTVPDSKREWVQWIGRTARQDSQGQYMVLVSQSEEPLSKYSDVREEATLVEDLLERQDGDLRAKLDRQQEKSDRGIKIHKLCLEYYRKFPNPPSWPSTHKPLRDLLERHQRTDEELKQFARTHGLTVNLDG